MKTYVGAIVSWFALEAGPKFADGRLIDGFVKFEDKGRSGKFISVYSEMSAATA